MITSIWSPEFQEIISQAREKRSIPVTVGNKIVEIQTPFPSPVDWRDQWIYFIMLDRFNNPLAPPQHEPWDGWHDDFQGGTFEGVRTKLDYLKALGAGAIWLTPVIKNCPKQPGTYHGYGFQNLLAVDPRFGTETELQNLVYEAHARDIYVILDVVLNHAGNVFEYQGLGAEADWLLDGVYTINWRDENGLGRSDWTEAPADCPPDAAVWPKELRQNKYFRRKGRGGEAGGDFSALKELVTEEVDDSGYYPVRDILIKAYQYLIARFDVDGFRIDTLKYVKEDFARIFGNAVREFALSIGKENFFTFGEVWDSEEKIAAYIGRNASNPEDLVGVDAALDFPLFYSLPGMIKGIEPPPNRTFTPLEVANIFEHRKEVQKNHLSSHGEAGKYFVTFLDNHDQHQRFYYSAPDNPNKYDDQVAMGVGSLFALQGIPCLYYGIEQGLHGAGDDDKYVREALWGQPNAFDTNHPFFKEIQAITRVRAGQPALRYGRQYFREISGDGINFGLSPYRPGVAAFSRILNDIETLIVINTQTEANWTGQVIVDFFLNPPDTSPWKILYSNRGAQAEQPEAIRHAPKGSVAVYRINGEVTDGPIRTIRVNLKPMEIQILGK